MRSEVLPTPYVLEVAIYVYPSNNSRQAQACKMHGMHGCGTVHTCRCTSVLSLIDARRLRPARSIGIRMQLGKVQSLLLYHCIELSLQWKLGIWHNDCRRGVYECSRYAMIITRNLPRWI